MSDKDSELLEKFLKDKKFHIKELITREVKLNDLNDVFSDMKKNKIIGKCIINFIKNHWIMKQLN